MYHRLKQEKIFKMDNLQIKFFLKVSRRPASVDHRPLWVFEPPWRQFRWPSGDGTIYWTTWQVGLVSKMMMMKMMMMIMSRMMTTMLIKEAAFLSRIRWWGNMFGQGVGGDSYLKLLSWLSSWARHHFEDGRPVYKDDFNASSILLLLQWRSNIIDICVFPLSGALASD